MALGAAGTVFVVACRIVFIAFVWTMGYEDDDEDDNFGEEEAEEEDWSESEDGAELEDAAGRRWELVEDLVRDYRCGHIDAKEFQLQAMKLTP